MNKLNLVTEIILFIIFLPLLLILAVPVGVFSILYIIYQLALKPEYRVDFKGYESTDDGLVSNMIKLSKVVKDNEVLLIDEIDGGR